MQSSHEAVFVVVLVAPEPVAGGGEVRGVDWARAARAEALVDLQKKVAELLGRTLPTADGPNGTR